MKYRWLVILILGFLLCLISTEVKAIVGVIRPDEGFVELGDIVEAPLEVERPIALPPRPPDHPIRCYGCIVLNPENPVNLKRRVGFEESLEHVQPLVFPDARGKDGKGDRLTDENDGIMGDLRGNEDSSLSFKGD